MAVAIVACFVVLFPASAALCLTPMQQALLDMPKPAGVVQGSWYFLGPFAHTVDFWQEQTHGPEQGVKLDAVYKGKYGDITWRETPEWKHDRATKNVFDILEFPRDDCDIYAYRTITSPAALSALLYYDGDDALTVWLNGKQVVRDWKVGRCFPRAKMVRVNLVKGENQLLVRCDNKGEGFEFCCELQPVLDAVVERNALEQLLGKYPNDPSAVNARFRLIELCQQQGLEDEAASQYKALLENKDLDDYDRALVRSVEAYRPRGLGPITKWTSDASGATFEGSNGKLMVRFVGSGLARLTFVPTGVEYPLGKFYRELPVKELKPAEGVVAVRDGDAVRVPLGKTAVTVDLKTGWMRLDGPKVSRSIALSAKKDDVWADVFTIPGEGLFGGGEQFFGPNLRGKSIGLGNSDRAWGGQYLNLPFVLTSNQDAFFMNSYGPGQLEADTPQFAGKLHLRLEDRVADLFWMTGEPKKLTGDYCRLTGLPQMPPDWAFGVWFSRNSYGDEKEALDVAQKLRDDKIPSEVLVLEAWREGDEGMAHEDWTKWGTKKKWPDPEGLCTKLHALGYKVVLWTMPWYMLRPAHLWPWEQEAIDKKYFLTDPDGTTPYGFEKSLQWCSVSPDFTNPKANEWWDERYMPLLDKVKGADAFKTDMGENTGGEAQTYQGWTKMSNLFTALYPKVVYEMTEKKLGEGVVFARTGGVGSQRYPILWSGDISAIWPGLKEAISGALSSAACGYSFISTDAGGYWDTPSPKIYTRWFQFACFLPVMQFHGQTPREPWFFGEETIPICRYYCDLHTRLKPYIEAAGKLSCETGVPIVRPLWMEFPSDNQAYKEDEEYCFGSDFLVAPVSDQRDTRTVYLPAGKWVDWWTGATISGPTSMEVTSDIDKIPVYVKAGADVLKLRPADGKGTLETAK